MSSKPDYTKVCVECAHYAARTVSDAKCTRATDVVTGRRFARNPYAMRSKTGECGPRGLLHSPRQKESVA